VTQLAFYHQAGLVTFNGPSVMAGFAQIEAFPGAVEHVRSLLFETAGSYEYRPFASWVDGYADWSDPATPAAVGELRAA
jgi:muramoyltetrapeptide carboxypeptidase LdcA involved in peptidoglycan recycling